LIHTARHQETQLPPGRGCDCGAIDSQRDSGRPEVSRGVTQRYPSGSRSTRAMDSSVTSTSCTRTSPAPDIRRRSRSARSHSSRRTSSPPYAGTSSVQRALYPRVKRERARRCAARAVRRRRSKRAVIRSAQAQQQSKELFPGCPSSSTARLSRRVAVVFTLATARRT
jgi:hypothetical protein